MSDKVTPTPVKNQRLVKMRDELTAERAKIVAVLTPARELHDKLVNDPRLLEARRIIKECNARLGPIDTELAALARALGSKGIRMEPGVFSKG